MKVTATFVGKPDQYGRMTVYIRSSHKGKRHHQATKIKLLPNQLRKGIVVNHPEARHFNKIIKGMVEAVEKHDMRNDSVEDDPLFLDYAMACMRIWENTRRPETMRQAMSEYRKFQAFAPKLRLSQVTADVLYQYERHCFDQGNSKNTVWKSQKFVRKVVRRAWKEQKIKTYPFAAYEMPRYQDPRRQYLTDTELSCVESVAYNGLVSPEARLCATWFMIGAYTALRYSDWHQFDRSTHIVSNRLILHTTKNGEIVSMPLVPVVRKLFESIRYGNMPYTNKHCNALLKDVARLAGLKKPLSCHIARHTFGVRAAHVMSLEACARLMGISVRVCQVYYKVVDKVSDREYAKLFEKTP